jgi:hypothetical protein
MFMDPDSMRIKVFFLTRKFELCLLFIRFTIIIYIFSHSTHLYAGSWTAIPSLQLQEIYSDNIELLPPGRERGALVTVVSPGISARYISPKSTLNLDYRMQNIYNSGGDDGLRIANQLQYNSHNTFIRNLLFLDSESSISQQNFNNNRLAVDNIAGSGDTTTVTTFSLSPYITPHFGGFANGLFRVNFNTITTGISADEGTATDTINLEEIVQLNSGSDFKRISWALSFNNNESLRSGGDDVKFQSSNAIIRAYLHRKFNFFAQAGHSNNSFRSNTDSSNNGIFYTFGAQWIPSQRFNIEAGYGNNRFVTVNIAPIRRVNWSTTYRNRDIGLNAGETWQSRLSYRTRRSIWSLTHDNDTTTTQQILLELQPFTITDPFGNPILDPVSKQPVLFATFLPNFTNEVIVRRLWNFSVAYNTGKSTISASAFNERRVFQVSGYKETVRGLNASWIWQFAPRTSAYVTPRWQQIDRAVSTLNPIPVKDHRYDFAIGVNRTITNRMNASLEFRHINQSSDLESNEYRENRATASVNMRF